MQTQTKNILITGGCGYVGNQLVKSCLNRGHKVWNIDLEWFGNPLQQHHNLTHINADIRHIDHIKLPETFDIIFHLANIANDPCGELDGALTWEVNTLATQLLAEWALEHGHPHFIYASSGSVYGIKSEDKVTEELSLKPISDYNKSKMVSERVLLSYADQLPVTIIRPASVCGLSDRMRLDLVVNMLTIQALTKNEICILGGRQIRPSIHIKDLIRVYELFAFEKQSETGIYNAGFDNISVLELAERIQTKIPGCRCARKPSNDPRSYRLCSDKLMHTGFTPTFGIDQAIDEVIEAYSTGRLEDKDVHYNIKTMKALLNQSNDLNTMSPNTVVS